MRRQSGFLEQPHPTLYPPIWGDDKQMRPQARLGFLAKFFENAEPVFPDIRSWVRFAAIGSGASFNWDETGDFDIQVWVSHEDVLKGVREVIIEDLMNLTVADFGLAGTMGVQYYAKPGRGTPEENLSGQPYACYDMDLDKWLAEPFPITPQMYGDLFILVKPRAEEMAEEADYHLSAYDRAKRNLAYWEALDAEAEGYHAQVERARITLTDTYAKAKAYFHQMMLMRGKAYKPGGEGIFDDRDAIWKLLEVWGVTGRLKDLAHTAPEDWGHLVVI